MIILVALQIATAAADSPEDQDACPLASLVRWLPLLPDSFPLLQLSDFISLQPGAAVDEQTKMFPKLYPLYIPR